MGAEQSINMYSVGMYVCLAIVIICFGLAIWFFIRLGISKESALFTGRKQKKSNDKMKQNEVLQSTNDLKHEQISNSDILANMNMTSKTEDFKTEEIKPEASVPESQNVPEPASEPDDFDALGATAILGTRPEMDDPYGATTILDPSRQKIPPVRFDIIEHTMVIHTDEVI